MRTSWVQNFQDSRPRGPGRVALGRRPAGRRLKEKLVQCLFVLCLPGRRLKEKLVQCLFVLCLPGRRLKKKLVQCLISLVSAGAGGAWMDRLDEVGLVGA